MQGILVTWPALAQDIGTEWVFAPFGSTIPYRVRVDLFHRKIRGSGRHPVSLSVAQSGDGHGILAKNRAVIRSELLGVILTRGPLPKWHIVCSFHGV
jgi:hypothetical protein